MSRKRRTPVHNKRKRSGPRSAAGKAIASRNALRHGFAAQVHGRAASPERVERLAKAIIGNDRDPAVIAQAYRIAENELLLGEIAAHKVSVVERLRELHAVSFAVKDNSLELATAKFMQAWLIEREIQARLPAVLKRYDMRLAEETLAKPRADYEAAFGPAKTSWPKLVQALADGWADRMAQKMRRSGWRMEEDDFVPRRLKALLHEPSPSEESKAVQCGSANETAENNAEERDEYEALEAAVQDLIRLDRYEQRAWSRQKRAIRQLASIKLERRLERKPGMPKEEHSV